MSTVRGIAPILPVRDLDVAMDHYRRLGFSVRRYAGGGYGFATRDGIELPLGVVGNVNETTSSALLFVDGADELARAWREREIEVHTPVDTDRDHMRARSSIPMAPSSASARRCARDDFTEVFTRACWVETNLA